MKKSIRLLTLFSIVISTLFLSSCWGIFNDCIEGRGPVVSDFREVPLFDYVETNGSYDVYVERSNHYKIEVEAQNNLLDYIETYTSGNRLIIETRRNTCIENSERISIFVSVPYLRGIEINGSGYASCYGFESDEFIINIDGSGDMHAGVETEYMRVDIAGSGYIDLIGSANECDFLISGSGEINAFDFPTNICYSRISGSGDIYTTVFDFLEVDILGSGNVYFKGNPQISVDISGTGDLIEWKK